VRRAEWALRLLRREDNFDESGEGAILSVENGFVNP
jgi:hypothetical protein